MNPEQESYDEETPTVLTAYFSGPDKYGMPTSASQTLVVSEDEEFDEELPVFLLRLRAMLEYSGAKKEVIDDLLNEDRIKSHLPKTIVDEHFLSEEAENEIENSPRKEALTRIMELDSKDQITSVEIERRGMSNFMFHYRKGKNSIRLPKSFFDDIFESEVEYGFFGDDDDDGVSE